MSPQAAAKLRRILRKDGVHLAILETKLSRDAIASAAAEMLLHRGTREVLERWLDGVDE